MNYYHTEVWDAVCATQSLGKPFRTCDALKAIARHFPNRTDKGLTQALAKVLKEVERDNLVTRNGTLWSLCAKNTASARRQLPVEPPSGVISVLQDKDSPFVARLSMDKSCYEVVEATNEDWRDVITEDQIVRCRKPTYREAEDERDSLVALWKYQRIKTILEAT